MERSVRPFISKIINMSSEVVEEGMENKKNTEKNHKGVSDHHHGVTGRKPSSQKLRRYDSLDIESRKFSTSTHASKGPSMSVIMKLAFQSLGIVYGDLGTSPLYVYPSVFPDGIKNNDDILGVLSLIFYTITLITLVKYGFIVLRATDNGDGGTFALYSLICRYAKVGLIPNQQIEDAEVSNYQLDLPKNNRMKMSSSLKSTLENSHFAKLFLLLVTMLGTSMLIGDGILTPCISVLSAVVGIKEAAPSMTNDRVVGISIAILICLFMVQRFGTHKVGYTFAPILSVWFIFIGGIGVYNFIKYDPTVIKALNPKYIVDYFIRNKKDAWISLGGIVLCTTGTEAMFADVGHFTVRSIQISICSVIYPAIMLAYTGQSSFLRKNNDLVSDTFYKSIPRPLFWPMFVVAVLASIIASQSLISGTFAIIQQSLSLGCFPRVKIVHTSAKYEGQVYIPEVNYILMLLCIVVTAVFKTTTEIGNAFGIAVVFVMTLTSALLVLIMIMIWKTHILLVITYVLIIGSVELVYLSSCLYKFKEGGYLPLAFAAVLMTIMYVWNNVYRRKYYYELEQKVSPEKLKEITSSTNLLRLPGLAMFYSELVQGIPPIFKHYVANFPALHSVIVFVSIKSLPISKVPMEERFLFRRVEHELLNVFRCVARYGYTDVRSEQEPFEDVLFKRLKAFIADEFLASQRVRQSDKTEEKMSVVGDENDELQEAGNKERLLQEAIEKEMDTIEKALSAGIVHLIGESEVVASKGSGIGKRILIDYAYNFMMKNLRQCEKVFDIPHKRMVKVGMTYEL
ncbi:potassium transporter 5-like [Gastrolobium bilobum]|uniref:potassium transporter 5-like n=1 Tax=Gastrolobium bilobum TaxID=150636 RepID=UPI002AAFD854|nr:potassium transporter 5-like [Gastrolobium bilobum]